MNEKRNLYEQSPHAHNSAAFSRAEEDLQAWCWDLFLIIIAMFYFFYFLCVWVVSHYLVSMTQILSYF